MSLTPDEFQIVMDDELREIWRRFEDTDVRRVILEVHRAREVADRCRVDAEVAEAAYRCGTHGEAAARLRIVAERLHNEAMRLGIVGGIPVQVPIQP